MTLTFEQLLLLASIAAFAPTLGSIAALIVALRMEKKVDDVHIATNSMKDALVAAARAQALLEGNKAGREEQRRESGE